MIAYEDLVVALTNWRIQQGLPTNAATFMSPSAGTADLSLPLADSQVAEQVADDPAAEDPYVLAEQADDEQVYAVDDEAIDEQVYAVDDEAIDEELVMGESEPVEASLEVGDEAIDEEVPLAPHELASETRDEELLAAGSLEQADEADAEQSSLSYDDETLFGDAPMPGESAVETATEAAADAPRDPDTYDASDLEVSADEIEAEEEIVLTSTEEVLAVDYAAEPAPQEELLADSAADGNEESFADLNTAPEIESASIGEDFSGQEGESTIMNDVLDTVPTPRSIEMHADDPEDS